MKSKMNIKSIVIMAAVSIISLFFINMSLAVSTGKISVETANLRETADESAKILEQLSINEEIEVIEKTGNWYKVKAKGITGYLREDLITVNNGEQVENTNTNNTTNTNNEETTNTENQQTEQNVQNQTTEQNQTDTNVETSETAEAKTDKSEELGKRKIAENTRLKIVPVINATDIIEVKKDEEVNATEIINGWVCVEAQNTKGWVRKEKLQSQEEPVAPTSAPVPEQQAQTVIATKYVNSASVNVRKEASKTSEVVTGLTLNTAVEVLSDENGWSKVKVNGKEGYISSALLSSTKKQETTSRSSTSRKTTTKTTTSQTKTTTTQENTPVETAAPASGTGASVVAYAKQFIGTKYTYGGSSPSTGFDCSGFTSYVYKHFGISLPRTSGGQSGVGTAVSRSNLAAGDLVIYSGHVAIYVGGGQVIHAPRPGKSVCIVPVNQAASNYLGARRVL